jgi:hypothetical protein
MTAAGSIFAGFPDEVVERAVREIPMHSDRVTLKLIKSVCDELYAPILRDAERKRAQESVVKFLPSPPRSPEEQARIDAKVFNAFGRWPGGTPQSVIDESERRLKLFGYIWLDGKWQKPEAA